MSNNDLYCDKCKSQHHPADVCGKDIVFLKKFKFAMLFIFNPNFRRKVESIIEHGLKKPSTDCFVNYSKKKLKEKVIR